MKKRPTPTPYSPLPIPHSTFPHKKWKKMNPLSVQANEI
jgi:hypothetical protein